MPATFSDQGHVALLKNYLIRRPMNAAKDGHESHQIAHYQMTSNEEPLQLTELICRIINMGTAIFGIQIDDCKPEEYQNYKQTWHEVINKERPG